MAHKITDAGMAGFFTGGTIPCRYVSHTHILWGGFSIWAGTGVGQLVDRTYLYPPLPTYHHVRMQSLSLTSSIP